jgi:hypothetical protein
MDNLIFLWNCKKFKKFIILETNHNEINWRTEKSCKCKKNIKENIIPTKINDQEKKGNKSKSIIFQELLLKGYNK